MFKVKLITNTMSSNNYSTSSSIDLNTPKEIFHGWFSEKQKKAKGDNKHNLFTNNKTNPISHIYHNSKGEEIEVTVVSKDLNHGANENVFDDMKYKGMLIKWVGNIY